MVGLMVGASPGEGEGWSGGIDGWCFSGRGRRKQMGQIQVACLEE